MRSAIHYHCNGRTTTHKWKRTAAINTTQMFTNITSLSEAVLMDESINPAEIFWSSNLAWPPICLHLYPSLQWSWLISDTLSRATAYIQNTNFLIKSHNTVHEKCHYMETAASLNANRCYCIHYQAIDNESVPLQHANWQFHVLNILLLKFNTCQTSKTHVTEVNVKWSRYRPGVAQRVGRGIALLLHDRGTRRGWVFGSTLRPHFTPGKDPVTGGWVGLRAGLDGRKITSPPGFDPGPSSP